MTGGEDHAPGMKAIVISESDFDSLPDEIKSKITISEFVEQHSVEIRSPLIPPELLARYDNVVPGLAERLVEEMQGEGRFRREMESKSFEAFESMRRRGLAASASIAGLGLVCSTILGGISASYDSNTGIGAAVLIGLASIGGPVVARIIAERLPRQRSTDDDNL